jgi:hypothetical protein
MIAAWRGVVFGDKVFEFIKEFESEDSKYMLFWTAQRTPVGPFLI